MKQLIYLIAVGGMLSLMACHKEVDETRPPLEKKPSISYSGSGGNYAHGVFQKGYYYEDARWNLRGYQGTGEYSIYFAYSEPVLKCPSDTVVHWSFAMQNMSEGSMQVIFKQWDMDQDTVVIYDQYLTGASSGVLPLDSGTMLITNFQFNNFTGEGSMRVYL